MTLSARMDEIEGAINKLTDSVSKSNNMQGILYNQLFGMAVKIDLLQAVVMQILEELDSEIKEKVMDASNLQRLAETVTNAVEVRLDTIGWGYKERADSAAFDQMVEDGAKARVNDD